ncbi:Putative esterase [Candidatus Izimaplasma bacterium HR1]|jgi:predicted alpha/beta superfamily hydrolase|uniref:alpha/beta hydrolase n=1 Tax=Candidatus Izimoplasma sp. HR1 TaxID=1541959 RepID=UPI0004F753EA|nr:Putative esterase [Candidatus Izimaplasma bacterium HR1]
MKEYTVIITYSEELERDVKVYVSLPDNYHNSDKSYPVLYMNDGEILFNDYDGYTGKSWGIMESFKTDPSSPEVVLVGIMSAEVRNNELFPFTFKSRKSDAVFGGKAKDYLDYIVNTLMPVINKKYRVLTTPDKTGILGISVGGVCSMYAATSHSEHFKLFASISSALRPNYNEMVELMEESDFSNINKMYLDVGTNESPNENVSKLYVDTNQTIANILKDKTHPDKIKFELIEGSQHIEEDWDKRFPSIIKYLFN